MIYLVRAWPVNRAVLAIDLAFHSDWHIAYLFCISRNAYIRGGHIESSARSELRIGKRLIGLHGQASRADQSKYENREKIDFTHMLCFEQVTELALRPPASISEQRCFLRSNTRGGSTGNAGIILIRKAVRFQRLDSPVHPGRANGNRFPAVDSGVGVMQALHENDAASRYGIELGGGVIGDRADGSELPGNSVLRNSADRMLRKQCCCAGEGPQKCAPDRCNNFSSMHKYLHE